MVALFLAHPFKVFNIAVGGIALILALVVTIIILWIAYVSSHAR